MFACPECGKTVASEKGLKNHRSKMHGVRGPHYGKKAKAANGRIAAGSPGRATEPGINAAVHRLVSTAIKMAELAEDAVAAGEAVMDAVKPLRLRYIALKKRADALAASGTKMQADLDEEN